MSDFSMPRRVGLLFAALLLAMQVFAPTVRGQANDPAAEDARVQRETEARLKENNQAQKKPTDAKAAPAAGEKTPLNWMSLLTVEGGVLMIPIWGLSVVALAFAVERTLALRRERVIPHGLVEALGEAASNQSAFDPRRAYRICQQFPSAAADVIRAMLLKVGRPHSEVEHAVAEAANREAAKLYNNVRWLNMSAAVAPLLGLLGTVQGMIMSFYTTASLAPGQNKAQVLAEGIYIALATTFAGLTVAIPATVVAHWLEGRIQNLFREIDELLFNLLPQVERFEGKLRMPANGEAVEAKPEPQGAAK